MTDDEGSALNEGPGGPGGEARESEGGTPVGAAEGVFINPPPPFFSKVEIGSKALDLLIREKELGARLDLLSWLDVPDLLGNRDTETHAEFVRVSEEYRQVRLLREIRSRLGCGDCT